jgi:hypothetical protein
MKFSEIHLKLSEGNFSAIQFDIQRNSFNNQFEIQFET